jgi:hypothetical protein
LLRNKYIPLFACFALVLPRSFTFAGPSLDLLISILKCCHFVIVLSKNCSQLFSTQASSTNPPRGSGTTNSDIFESLVVKFKFLNYYAIVYMFLRVAIVSWMIQNTYYLSIERQAYVCTSLETHLRLLIIKFHNNMYSFISCCLIHLSYPELSILSVVTLQLGPPSSTAPPMIMRPLCGRKALRGCVRLNASCTSMFLWTTPQQLATNGIMRTNMTPLLHRYIDQILSDDVCRHFPLGICRMFSW